MRLVMCYQLRIRQKGFGRAAFPRFNATGHAFKSPPSRLLGRLPDQTDMRLPIPPSHECAGLDLFLHIHFSLLREGIFFDLGAISDGHVEKKLKWLVMGDEIKPESH
jgi:hypothetical protein